MDLMQSGSCDVKGEPRSGRPATDKIDAILEKVEQHRHISSYKIAEELGIDNKTVCFEDVVFHHDNARLHSSLAIQQILKEFGREVLMRAPHSPRACTLRLSPVSISSEFFK
ncbi:hypothetical protein EVAR_37939_1 [Eumeta japonica]|uniref:Histone-lysine N-methyltransferase SETMAR n=1 Tax=Eumeta variegata TaxID=151549 RepID=A0A4C1XDA5_EUMVA|nr:hypothetical protein EVAR_37939_1 [Eumeta japonica]